MAYNLDQLITKFLSIRYPYPRGNCKIARNEVDVRRKYKEQRIKKEMREWPYAKAVEILNDLIEKEKVV